MVETGHGEHPADAFARHDPLAPYDERTARGRAAFSAPGALERTLTLPFATAPTQFFSGVVATDHLAHA